MADIKRWTSDEDLRNRHAYHPPANDGVKALHEQIRNQTLDLALWLNSVLPESPEKTVALNHVRDAMMYANAAVAIHGGKL